MGDGQRPPQTVVAECTTPAGSETRIAADWYCTNKPNIDVPITLALPNGGLNVPITGITVGANFTPGGGALYSHSTTVALNGSLVGSAIVPTTARIQNTLPPQALILGGSSPTQLLSLRSTHTNGGHYTIASGFTVTVEYDEHTRTGCFTQQQIADAAGGVLTCNALAILQIPDETPIIAVDIDLAEGNITQLLTSGTLMYEITVTNQTNLAQTNVVVQNSSITLMSGANSGEHVTAYEISQEVIDDENITISDLVSNGATFTIAELEPLVPQVIRVTVTLDGYNYREDGFLLSQAIISQVGTEQKEFDRAEVRLPQGLEVNFYRGFEVNTALNAIPDAAFIPSANGTVNLAQLATASATSVPMNENFESRQASYRLTGWIDIPDNQAPVTFQTARNLSDYEGLRIWVGESLVYSDWADEEPIMSNPLPAGMGQQLFVEYYFYSAPEDISEPEVPSAVLSELELRQNGTAFITHISPLDSDGIYTSVTDFPVPSEREVNGVIQPGPMAYYATCPVNDAGVRSLQLVPAFTGRGQEMFDMRAIAEFRPDDSTPTGLIIHDGPTWNAMRFDADPTMPSFNVIPWGTVVTVDRRMVFEQSDDITDQVWYRLSDDDDDPNNTNPPYYDPANDRWIAVRMPGTLRTQGTNEIKPFVYGVGLGRLDADTASFCSEVTDIRTLPQTDPDTLISFTYDRQAAAEYGMAHAYRNSTFEDNLVYPDNQNRVTSRLDNNNPPVSAADGSVANPFVNVFLRYAYFIYPEQVTGQTGFTGSAVFTSESIWMGGLPMTFDFQSTDVTCPSQGTAQSGWRYCSQDEIASFAWRAHEQQTIYYSSNGNSILTTDRGVLAVNALATGRTGSPERERIAQIAGNHGTGGLPLLTQEENRRAFYEEYLSPDSTSARAFEGIQNVQQGDYVYINRANPDTGHGFLVVGWGEITSCPDALSRVWVFEDRQGDAKYGRLFSHFNDAGTVLIVPYVVDFSGGINTGQLQRPRPRPFYCAQYDDNTDGNPSTRNLFALEDNYAFFGYPASSVELAASQLYTPLVWNWGN